MIIRAASASIIGDYEVFGCPQDPPLSPNPITWEKFPADATHIDKPVGYRVDLHCLIVYLPLPEREKLKEWIPKKHFTLREAAELIGSLIHAAATNREAKAFFSSLRTVSNEHCEANFRRKLNTFCFSPEHYAETSARPRIE